MAVTLPKILPPFDADNPWAQQRALIAAISALDPMRFGLTAGAEELEGRANYISSLIKLMADHIECLMADADASLTTGKIDETDVGFIIDAGSDCAGQLVRAAELVLEAA